MPSAVLVLVLVLSLSACREGGAPGQGAPHTVRDSAGVTIVETAPPPGGERVAWEVEPEPSLRIGRVDGEFWEALHQVRHVRTLRDGRVAVVNSGSAQVFLYTAAGTFLQALGGAGDGPGEFRAPWRVHELPGDSLIVLDLQFPAHLSVFTPEGVFVRRFPRPQPDDAFESTVVGQLDDGSLLLYGGLREPDVTVLRLHGMDVLAGKSRLFRVAPDGTLATGLGDFVTGATATPDGTIAFGARGHYAAAGDGFHHGPGYVFEIRSYDAGGALRRILRHEAPERPVTEAMIDEYRGVRERSLAEVPPSAREALRQRMGTVHYPPVLPAHGDILAARDGSLWVQRWEPFQPAVRVWDVFGPDGAYQGMVELPERLALLEIGEGAVLGIERDELDVESVVRRRLRRPGGR